MDKILRMIKNDQYVSLDILDKEKVTVKKLKSEGYLLSKTDDYLAKKVFKQLIEYNKKDFPAWYMLFSLCVKRGEYIEATDVLSELMKSTEYRNDNLVYLLLLDYIVDLPDYLRMEIDNICFDDIEVKNNDVRFNVENQNEIRFLILEKRFGLAMSKFKSQREFTSQEKVIKKLLHKVLVQYDWVSFYNEKRDYQSLYEYYLGIDNLTEAEKRTQELAYNADIVTNDGYMNNNFKIDKPNDKDIHEDIKTYINMIDGANKEFIYSAGIHTSLNEVLYDVHYLLEAREVDLAVDRIINYLYRINRKEFIPFIEKALLFIVGRNTTILYDALLRISMPIVNIDPEFYKSLFYKKIQSHDLDAAGECLDILKSLPKEYLRGICLEYLEYVYNDNLYRYRNITYPNLEHDTKLKNEVSEGIERLKTSRDILLVDIDSYSDTKKIKRFMNKYVKYRLLEDGDKYVLIVARNRIGEYDKEETLKNIELSLEKEQYKKAINIAYQALANDNKFDIDILEALAKIFDKMKRKYMASKYRRIKDLVIANDELVEEATRENEYVLDSDTDYMLPNIPEITSYVKKNKNLYLLKDEFGMDEEDLVFSLVTIARELYRETNFKLGDKLMSFVRSSSYKSKELTRFINEVNNNKKFYQYREKETIVDFTKKLIK